MTNKSKTLYIGMTNDLRRRVWEHKHKILLGFTMKYSIDQLVYFEMTTDVNAAIRREKEMKKWRREKKISLIESINPSWSELSDGWYV